ncbi:MAG: winged helix-turn-helix transcriptional regulator [archaeon]|nr:winged helix-turn-helix transcriptional regulator [archaeon]
MIFEFAEVRCILGVLRILNNQESRYSELFKKTKVSHITLQSVLRELTDKGLIKKHDIGHQNVHYNITPKGQKLFLLLLEVEKLIKS